MLREAHPPDRRSTVAHFMQTSLSASSAFRPAASSPLPGTQLASTRATQLALLQSDYHLLKKRMFLEAAAYKSAWPLRASLSPRLL